LNHLTFKPIEPKVYHDGAKWQEKSSHDLCLTPKLGDSRGNHLKKKMKSHVQIKLFASLQEFTPPSSDKYPIDTGLTIHSLLEKLKVPQEKAKLIFINGVKADLAATLKGGERVGIFPPVGGG